VLDLFSVVFNMSSTGKEWKGLLFSLKNLISRIGKWKIENRRGLSAYGSIPARWNHSPALNQTCAMILGNGTSAAADVPTGVLVMAPVTAPAPPLNFFDADSTCRSHSVQADAELLNGWRRVTLRVPTSPARGEVKF